MKYETLKEATEDLMKKGSNKKKAGMIWFITEIIQIIIFVMGSIMLLWLYAPFSMLAKMAITTLAGIIIYDVFKNFVYVRYILWKETL